MGEGAVAVGAWVVAAFGTAATAAVAATGIAAIINGIIGGLIIGAAVGGLTAAVTGGSIGKGILYGAIGGAVTGGLSGYFAGSGAVASGAMQGSQLYGWEAAQVSQATAQGAYGAGAASASGSLLGESTKVLADNSGGILSGLGSSLVSKAMEGSAAEDMAKERQKFEAEQREKEMELREKLQNMSDGSAMAQAELAAATQRYGVDAQRDTAKAQLAEQTRQFDVGNQLQEQMRQRQSSAVQQAVAGRKGVLRGAPASIDQQVATAETTRDYQQQLAPTLEQQEARKAQVA